MKTNKKLKIILLIILIIFLVLLTLVIINQMKNKKPYPIYKSDTSKWDLNKVNIVKDTDEVCVPVPKGFIASEADGEHTVGTGFVIYEGNEKVTNENVWKQSKERNQFVWIPVPDVNRIYEIDSTTGKKKAKLYEYSENGRSEYINDNYEPALLKDYDKEKDFQEHELGNFTSESFLEELQTEFDATIESIEKYGGFYIGRYETGNLSTETPVIRRMNEDIHSQPWYTLYHKMSNISSNENVRTNIIWGCLWDETLQFLIDTKNKTYSEINNSSNWSNCTGSEFEYTTILGEKKNLYDEIIPTGSTEITKANNIYDLAGNVWDFTLEAFNVELRVLRGGDFMNPPTIFSAGGRSGNFSNINNPHDGVRAYFYIK